MRHSMNEMLAAVDYEQAQARGHMEAGSGAASPASRVAS